MRDMEKSETKFRRYFRNNQNDTSAVLNAPTVSSGLTDAQCISRRALLNATGSVCDRRSPFRALVVSSVWSSSRFATHSLDPAMGGSTLSFLNLVVAQ